MKKIKENRRRSAEGLGAATAPKKGEKVKNLKTEKARAKAPADKIKKARAPAVARSRHAAKDKSEPQIRESAKGGVKVKMPKEAKPEAKRGPNKTRRGGSRADGRRLRIIPLGGLAEIGKNMTVFEYGDDIVIIDIGIAFPDEELLGVDLVIPDFSYLVENAHKIRGILLTHGHEDHIGGVPYFLLSIDAPVYGTPLTLGILEGKLGEIKPPNTPRLYPVEAGDIINLGVFSAEFIHVNHSIADASAILLNTPVGRVFHSGDFKLDVSPIDGRMMDIARIGEIGKEGVEMLLLESTNAERSGYTPSERTVGSSLERIFMQYEKSRLIIATFSSNVHRVQQIINASARWGRKVAVLGRSMVNVIGAATRLGYMELPEGVLIDIADIKRYKPEDITLITTGSQGEPMSALYRIAFGEHDKVKLTSGDTVVLSSSAIPGNEKFVGKIVNALVKAGVRVVSDSVEDVHVSGHACREELKLMMALLKPKYLMPIHGEHRHLFANREIGEFMGIAPENIFISEIGRVLELGGERPAFAGSVPSGRVFVDGSGVGDIGSVVIRERKHLSEDGLVAIVMAIDLKGRYVLSEPEVVSRGFVFVKEAGDLLLGVRELAGSALSRLITRRGVDFNEIKTIIKDEVSRYIYKETKRKPMVLPIIIDI